MVNANKLRDCDSPRCRVDDDCTGLEVVQNEAPTPLGTERWESERECQCRCHIECITDYDLGMSEVEDLDDDSE